MKKKQLFLTGLLMAFLLLTGNFAMAQKDTTMWVTLLEYRVHDESVFQKNYPVVKAFWLKADTGIEWGRLGSTSESGRIYSLAFFKGADNFGAFMAKRVKTGDAFTAKEPAISKENMQNINGASMRSIWIRIDSLSHYEANYKMDNYDFRKLQFITVAPDKIKEFEAAASKQLKMDVANGILYNFIVFKCTDGYPTNTYMLVLPDKSITDYYKNREARNTKRDQTKSAYAPLHKILSDWSAVNRIDHLNRVK
jgi:hypothetical protein